MGGNAKFQFSIRRLFILTTCVAVVAAVVSHFFTLQFARSIVGVYMLLLTVYVVIRGPSLYAGLVEIRNQRRQVLARRAELARNLTKRDGTGVSAPLPAKEPPSQHVDSL